MSSSNAGHDKSARTELGEMEGRVRVESRGIDELNVENDHSKNQPRKGITDLC